MSKNISLIVTFEKLSFSRSFIHITLMIWL